MFCASPFRSTPPTQCQIDCGSASTNTLCDQAMECNPSSSEPAAHNAASSVCRTSARRPPPRGVHTALLTGVPGGLARLRLPASPPPAATTVRMASSRACGAHSTVIIPALHGWNG